jgi:trigger factor
MAKTILARQPDGTIQLTITVDKGLIQKSFSEFLTEAIQKVEVPGFRKGKAPKKLAEEKIDKNEIYELIIQELVPEAYLAAVKENQLKPIISPKIELLKAKENEDWEIRATTAEAPKIELKDYRKIISQALAPAKLWTPEKGDKADSEKKTEATQEEKIQKTIEILLKNFSFSLPQVIVEDELNRSLTNLLNQVNSLGMTVEQYLQSSGKTSSQLREEYQTKIEGELRLLFILSEIANREEIKISDQEIESLAKASGDEKLSQQLSDPLQKEYLKGILARRKALETLASL